MSLLVHQSASDQAISRRVAKHPAETDLIVSFTRCRRKYDALPHRHVLDEGVDCPRQVGGPLSAQEDARLGLGQSIGTIARRLVHSARPNRPDQLLLRMDCCTPRPSCGRVRCLITFGERAPASPGRISELCVLRYFSLHHRTRSACRRLCATSVRARADARTRERARSPTADVQPSITSKSE